MFNLKTEKDQNHVYDRINRVSVCLDPSAHVSPGRQGSASVASAVIPLSKNRILRIMTSPLCENPNEKAGNSPQGAV